VFVSFPTYLHVQTSPFSLMPPSTTLTPMLDHFITCALHEHEHSAELCVRFVSHLFACPDISPHRTASTTQTPTLNLLQHLKSRSTLLFALRQINLMEVSSYLEWQSNVDPGNTNSGMCSSIPAFAPHVPLLKVTPIICSPSIQHDMVTEACYMWIIAPLVGLHLVISC
jgi:hypothetical protein